MSAKTIYTCDYCGKPVEFGQRTLHLVTFNYAVRDMPDLHACSKEHMGLALAKAFGLPMDNNALRLVTEKNDALDAARAAIIECDNMRARLSKLEAQNHHAGELLAKAQARVADLEQHTATLEGLVRQYKTEHDHVEETCNIQRERIDALEKRLVEETTPLTVDGKTPGLAYLEGYKQEYARTMQYKPEDMDDCAALWRDMPSDDKREMEAGAVNVLRAFGPALAKQAVADALRKVRERIETDGLRIFEGERYGIDAIGCAVAMINTEISALESTKSVSITIPTKPTKPARVHGNCKACSGIGEIVCADCDGSGKHECAYCGGTGEYSAAEGNGQ